MAAALLPALVAAGGLTDINGTLVVFTIVGAAAGIGKLAGAAMEGIARQPNAAGDIRMSMLLAAVLIEGATFFALVVTILLALKA